MTIKDVLECGYFDGDDMRQRDYVVEINEERLKKWIIQEKLDLLDYPTSIEKKILLYQNLENELGKNVEYDTFTVKLV